MRQREAALSAAIIRWLNAQPGTLAVKEHVTVYSQAGEPDIRGVVSGRAFFIEVKLPGKEATLRPAQAHRLALWERAGAVVGVATSVEQAAQIWGAACTEK